MLPSVLWPRMRRKHLLIRLQKRPLAQVCAWCCQASSKCRPVNGSGADHSARYIKNIMSSPSHLFVMSRHVFIQLWMTRLCKVHQKYYDVTQSRVCDVTLRVYLTGGGPLCKVFVTWFRHLATCLLRHPATCRRCHLATCMWRHPATCLWCHPATYVV